MAEGMILPYLDIPFQHASPQVLKAMRRPANQEKTLERIQRWREICPDLAIRSTFIVGFPGETEEDFDYPARLAEGSPARPRRRFQYEPVEGAPANDLAGAGAAGGEGRALAPLHADPAEGQRQDPQGQGRQDACPSSSTRQGATVATGRTKYDAPEIDGAVHVASKPPLKPGEIVNVKIESSDEYDLHGTVV